MALSDQTSSSVTVTTERGGSASTCSGTFVDGTVNTNSFQYNGGSLGYSFSNDTASGAGTIQVGQNQSDDDLSPDVANMLHQSGVMATPQLVMAYGISGQLKKAHELLDEAIRKDPEYPLNYYNLACAFAKEGDKNKMLANLALAFQHKAHVLKDERSRCPIGPIV